MALLSVDRVTKRFGGLVAVNAVSFELERGERLAVVGPNGSGKSTLLNILSGVYRGDPGAVVLNGARVDQLRPSAIARAGIGRTFQNLQLFQGLSVLENVMVGRHCRLHGSVVEALLGLPRSRREERVTAVEALALLERVGLAGRARVGADSLSYGQRRLLEIARALATGPKVLMLDEPCAGLSAAEIDSLAALIRALSADGLSIIVIEHNMRFVLGLVDRVVVLNFGQKIADAAPEVIRRDPAVIEAYLGRAAHADG